MFIVPNIRTPDDFRIVQGVFEYVDTHGLPLDIVLHKLYDNKLMPDWMELYHSAINAGWNSSTIKTRMIEAIGDVYGPSFREGWEEKFEIIINSS